MTKGNRDEFHPNRRVDRDSIIASQLRLAEIDAQRALPSDAATMEAARRGERWAQDDLGDY